LTTLKGSQAIDFLVKRWMVNDEMNNLKIIIIATTIAVLAVATIGAAFAHTYSNSPYYGGMMETSTPYVDENWWTGMQEQMEDHWDEVQDEEWFDDVRAYMDQHLDDVESQDWFDEMTQFMDDQRDEYHYGSSYGYGYRGCH